MSTPDAEARLRTARALLSGALTGAALRDVDPDPPLADLGAEAGFGAVVVDSDLRLSVYVLDAWGAGAAVADGLRSRAESVQRLARVAVNGDLLFESLLALEMEAESKLAPTASLRVISTVRDIAGRALTTSAVSRIRGD